MPTNLRASLKSLVRLKPSESCCDLARHFKEGVMREVIGALVHHALVKYPNDKNFVWVDVSWIVLHTVRGPNKKVSMEARVADPTLCHSRRMVEHALLELREMGIISRPMDMEIGEHGMQHGFVVTPHDALCTRIKTGCKWVGPYKVRGTSWRSERFFDGEGKPTRKKTIVFTGFLKPEGTVPGTVEGTVEGTVPGTVEGTVEGTVFDVKAGYGRGYSVESPKTVEPIKDSQRVIDAQPSISEPRAGLYPVVQLVSVIQEDPPSRPIPQTGTTATSDDEMTKKEEEKEKEEEEEKEEETPNTLLLHSLTKTVDHGTPETESLAPPLTVAEHFESAPCDGDLRYLQIASDGLLTIPAKGSNSWATHKADELFGEYSVIDDAMVQAVREMGEQPLTSRNVLGQLFDRVIQIRGRVPKPVFKVMRELKEGGGSVAIKAKKVVEKKEPWRGGLSAPYYLAAKNAGVTIPETYEFEMYGKIPEANTWHDVWVNLAEWFDGGEQRGILMGEMKAIHDFAKEHDATKPKE